MHYSEVCGHCGHQISAYTFNLNPPILNAFRRLVNKWLQLRKPIKMCQLSLTPSQYTNFQSLGYFMIIRKVEEGWVPTPLGIQFFRGNTGLKTPAAHIGKRVLNDDHPAWKTHASKRKLVFMADYFPEEYNLPAKYDQRRKYSNEKTGQTQLTF